MRLLTLKLAAAGIAMIAVSGTAFAQAPLTIGSAPVTIPVNPAAVPALGGTLLLSTSSPITGAISGTLTSAVFQTGAAGSTLDFFYQFTANSPNGIAGGGINSFAAVTTSVAQLTGATGATFVASGTQYGTATRPAFASGIGVNFDFGTQGLNSGSQTSATFVIRTNAVTFSQTGSFSLQGAGQVGSTSTTVIAPLSSIVPVPEANAGLLASLVLPFLGGVVVLRRKK